MKEYPWRGSRKTIEKFVKKQKNWGLSLPPELSATQIRALYKKHKPKGYVAFNLISNILDHPNCPKDVIDDAYPRILDLYLDLGLCLAGLALRKELTPKQSMYLAERFFLEDIGDQALPKVIENAESGHKSSRKLLLKLLTFEPSHHFIRRYIRSMLKQGSRKKTKRKR